MFDAKTHNYVGMPVPPADLQALETECGCRLPSDYRLFLADIGSGVGPYYGLLHLSAIQEELQMITEDYQAASGVPTKPCDPFGLERQVIELRDRATLDFANLNCPATSGGFIPICHHGCEFVTVLIVAGACAGMVMDTTNFGSTGSEWFPAKCPPGVVEYRRKRCPITDFPPWPSFREWLDGWLRQCLFDMT